MMIIKKDRKLMISLISIILFNVFFMIMLICYSDIIVIVNKFLKNVTKEYWFWYLERPNVNNETIIIGVTKLLKIIFSIIFSVEFLHIIDNKKYINIIGKKNLVISLIIGFIIYCLSFLFIKYKAEHYRLFMTLISTEIASMILLNLVLKLKKENS